ncbi:MAG TPA: hypothetical protein VNU19_11660 [Candidatus Acidoferrum sp.]|jgi:hypothetical protein|nr:hypothetical protein [Candidatus Acidoferrum sp.]
MRNLLRQPLPWIVICECAIVAALAMVAWHMVASQSMSRALGILAAAPTRSASQAAGPAAQTPAGADAAPIDSLLPGLNLDSSFWRQRLSELNQGQNSFEQLEWRIVHAGVDEARRYVKSVVMPALERAERGGR